VKPCVALRIEAPSILDAQRRSHGDRRKRRQPESGGDQEEEYPHAKHLVIIRAISTELADVAKKRRAPDKKSR
jgi:hypothetical protein